MCNCGCPDCKSKSEGKVLEITNDCLYAVFLGVIVALIVKKLDF